MQIRPYTTLWILFLSLILLIIAPNKAQAALRLNELMASNNTILDQAGNAGDWIEIHNTGTSTVNVAGLYLTDDLGEPLKWQIPDALSLALIPPDSYLIIWADSSTSTNNELHAGFNLSAGGEELALFDATGQTLLDSVVFPSQQTDISYGRSPVNQDKWLFMEQPTPGQANIAGYEGQVADTTFSVDRGFYDTAFTVEITTETADADIWYTLDGSDPSTSNTAMIYTDPILIETTTCLRAFADKPGGWRPSNVDTQTYLFLDDVITFRQADAFAAGYPDTWFQSFPGDYEMDPEITQDPDYADQMEDALLSLPTLSIVTHKDNLFSHEFDENTGGIYIYPGHSTTGGQDWERPVSAEFFDANHTREFQVNCGLRIQGGESRRPNKMPKHSFSLRFRGEYGPGKLDFPLFGEDWPIQSFDSIQLRGFFNNTWAHWGADQRERAQYTRDQWIRDALTAMGHQDAGQGFYAHLYLNGMYWGLYNIEERPEEDHYAAYHGGDPDRVDAINGGRATNGTTQAWNALKNVARQGDWQRIQELMDVDNFIDFMMAHLYSGNRDLKDNGNWRTAGGGPDQHPWRFYSWDSEHIMEGLNHTSTTPSQDPTGLWQPLLQIDTFRDRFADRVHQHLFNDGTLTPEPAAAFFQKRSDEVELAMIAESARWGDYRRDMHQFSSGPYRLYTRNEYWYPERDFLLNVYFPNRTDIAIDYFRNTGLYPSLDAPVFYVNGQYQHGGSMSLGQTLGMTAPGTIFYTLDGSDPRESSTDDLDTVVLIPEEAAKRVLIPNQNIGTDWRGGNEPYNDDAWNDATAGQGGTGAVGYESNSGYESYITYDVSAMIGQNGSCYIRIPFAVTQDILSKLTSLSLHVRCDDGFVAFLNGIEVASINRPNPLQWNSTCANRSDDPTFAQFSLNDFIDELNPGDNVLAVQAINQSLTSSDFLFSAQLTGIQGEPDPGSVAEGAQIFSDPISLTQSAVVKARAFNGQWSALNQATYSVGPIAESLRISEIMYHPVDPNAEFIELTNIGTDPIDLNLVQFTDGVDFTFSPYALDPGQHVVVVRDIATFKSIYGETPMVAGQYQGSLNNAGERIVLADATGMIILDFRYEDDWYDSTDGDGPSLTVIDPVTTDPTAWSDKDTWQASLMIGGSPGQ